MGKRARLKKERRAAQTRSMFVAWGELQKLYASLPTLECKKLCTRACGMVPIADIELQEIRRRLGKKFPSKHLRTSPLFDDCMILSTPDMTCPLLVDGLCSVYDIRPMICRLYGMAEGMRCEHNCEPSRLLTDREAHDLLRRVRELSHGVTA